MKKKLVAVAVAAVLAAPLAAQAQTANVTLYGRLNLDLEYIGASQDGNAILADRVNTPNVSRLSENSSRFGLRGVEPLGGGLNAIFQIESSTPADAGGGTLAGRDSFVGLQGGWGSIKLGRMTVPYDDLTGIFGTITLNTSIFAMSSIWANNGGYSKAQGSFDARLSNVIRYDMPRTGGFDAGIAISLDSENGQTDPYVGSASGTYRNGPFVGAIAYEWNKNVRGQGLGDWAGTVTLGWDFGIVNVVGLYERLDYETVPNAIFTGSGLKRNFYGLTLTGPAGPGRWQAFWMHANDGTGGGQRVGGLQSGNDTGADHYQVSYVYPLSKRTAVYGGWSGLYNDARAGYNYGSNAYLGATATTLQPGGINLSGFGLGMWHNF